MTNIEQQIIDLVATDRIDIPISSMSGKLKRTKPELAKEIDLEPYKGRYDGKRVHARVEREDRSKARGMREGIELFIREHPKYGAILQGMIDEKREEREIHLYFGVNENCRLSDDDYIGVLTDLGFSGARARDLYLELIEISRQISRKRGEERSILIG